MRNSGRKVRRRKKKGAFRRVKVKREMLSKVASSLSFGVVTPPVNYK